MSFFARIFGGDEKKPQPKLIEKKEDNDMQKKIQREKAKVKIEAQLKQFDDKEKKLDVKVNSLKAKAKQFMSEGNEKQARKYLTEAGRINKQIEQVIMHKKTVLDNIYQLQSADMTAETAKILEQTKKHLEEHQKNSDKLMDLIEEANIRKREQDAMHERMKMLVQNDDDKQAEDEMFEEMMAEIKREKAKQQKNVAGKEIGVKVPEQKNKPVQQRDEIEDMLQGL